MDLSRRVVFELRHRQEAEFLKKELARSLSANLAPMPTHQAGNVDSAERTIADVEHGYATMLRSLSDPEYSKHLTIKSIHGLTAKLAVLRKMLDGLEQFRKKGRK